MSRPGKEQPSVADVLDSVFWEYRPEAPKETSTVADFFEHFDQQTPEPKQVPEPESP